MGENPLVLLFPILLTEEEKEGSGLKEENTSPIEGSGVRVRLGKRAAPAPERSRGLPQRLDSSVEKICARQCLCLRHKTS